MKRKYAVPDNPVMWNDHEVPPLTETEVPDL
jgi:hypothetical protein